MNARLHGFGLLLGFCWCVAAGAELRPEDACGIVRKAVAAREGLPEEGPPGLSWFCDITPSKDGRLLLVALRTSKPTPYSNLVGWFAVDRTSGKLFMWDDKTERTRPFQQRSR